MFKIDDKIKIKHTDGLTTAMQNYVGQVATIMSVQLLPNGTPVYRIDRDGGFYIWTAEVFDLVVDDPKDMRKTVQQLIAIIRDKAEYIESTMEDIRDIRSTLDDSVMEFENRYQRLMEEIEGLEMYLENDDE